VLGTRQVTEKNAESSTFAKKNSIYNTKEIVLSLKKYRTHPKEIAENI